jgi:hypothetical protein
MGLSLERSNLIQVTHTGSKYNVGHNPCHRSDPDRIYGEVGPERCRGLDP